MVYYSTNVDVNLFLIMQLQAQKSKQPSCEGNNFVEQSCYERGYSYLQSHFYHV